MGRIVFPLICMLACFCGLEWVLGDGTTTPKQTADAVKLSIQKLSRPEPEQREAAVNELLRTGAAAVPGLEAVALTGDVEAAILAVTTLERLQTAKEPEAIEATESALERISETGKVHVAGLAREALDRFADLRQERAVAYLKEHRATIWLYRDLNSERFDRRLSDLPHTIIIGRDWTGGDSALRQIMRVDSVEAIYLTKGHAIKEDAIAAFKLARPDVTLSLRGSAFLGIGHGSHQLGCIVGSVKPGTPAHNAGLKQGDVIVEFGGKPTRTPDDLIEAIATFDPGDQVQVVLLRDNALHVSPIGFRVWSPLQMVLEETLFNRQFGNAIEPDADATSSVLLPIAVLHSMKREVVVTLGVWKAPQ